MFLNSKRTSPDVVRAGSASTIEDDALLPIEFRAALHTVATYAVEAQRAVAHEDATCVVAAGIGLLTDPAQPDHTYD